MAGGLSRRAVLTALPLTLGLSGLARAAAPGLSLSGKFVQGGYAVGRTAPRAMIDLDGLVQTTASADGWFVIGFDRDAPPTSVLTVTTPDGSAVDERAIALGDFDIQRIDGLPPEQVSPTDPALLERLAAENTRKVAGFASQADIEGFREGFILPVVGARRSARFGGQRILNGEPRRPHYGVDLAVPVGTQVRSPASAIVAFAETGLHFEGGLLLLDHGQGLVTAYLHLSKILVSPGTYVRRGDEVALTGEEGRATGPHLCWRMKWRGRNMDPSLLVGAGPLLG
ncbi:M23 family metallopeptidase [Caulobacter vibrioides]|uniref:M23 family metallopeptidase n=1 Tax=Caulobacter vibrioides TaxID=155892 RepID=UPI000BB4B695|nr:M23 family metallopeptidase [Caulobacter vibrioides]ATC25252.1 M23 family peptidase [Caulobacter vibrioides]AZH13349.1 M23 family metallopeptidase [Caulobacter vibrioides]PLR14022.1 M23 family peptidase [Caulobacter vibrioides]